MKTMFKLMLLFVLLIVAFVGANALSIAEVPAIPSITAFMPLVMFVLPDLPRTSGDLTPGLNSEILICLKADVQSMDSPNASNQITAITLKDGKRFTKLQANRGTVILTEDLEGEPGTKSFKQEVDLKYGGVTPESTNYFDSIVNEEFILLLRDCRNNIVRVVGDMCVGAGFASLKTATGPDQKGMEAKIEWKCGRHAAYLLGPIDETSGSGS